MIRLSRLADYGVVLMAHMAARGDRMHTAHAAAEATRIPEPTVSKLFKALARRGLLESHRGAGGGYTLARAPSDIAVTEIIAAVDGPIALTECLDAAGEQCSLETICPTRSIWHRINEVVRRALEDISLADMVEPPARAAPAAPDGGRRLSL